MAKKKNKVHGVVHEADKSPLAIKHIAGYNAPWWAKNSGAFLLIGALTFILYFNTLQHEYAVDDAIVITENMYTVRGTDGIKDLLTHDTFLGFFKIEKSLVAGGRYRPLSLVSFALEIELFGQSPHTSHLINVLLYALCGIFIYLLLKQLFINAGDSISRWRMLPLITSLLFIAHPIHTEAVANIKGRDEILSMLFCCLGSWWLLQCVDGRASIFKMVIAFISFLLAMLSKENAVTFFLVVPLMLWLFRKPDLKRLFRVMLPVAAATVMFLILRQAYTNTAIGKEVTEIMNNPFAGMSEFEKYATIVFTFGKYLWLLLVPIKLTSDYYPFEITAQSFSSIAVLSTLIVTIIFLVLAILLSKKQPVISFGILFFGLTFSVVSNLVFPVGTFMNERFLFMPSLGFCLLLGYVLLKFSDFILKRNKSNEAVTGNRMGYKNSVLAPIALSVFSILMLAYSGRTIARNAAWKDNFTLFMTDIHNSPSSAKMNNAAGGELLAQVDKDIDAASKKIKTDQAKIYLKKAIRLYPKYSNAYLLLGNAYLKGDKDYASAFHYYKQGMVMYPGYTLAYNNMKILMGNWKDYSSQRDSINNYLKVSPRDPVPYYFMGALMENLNRPDSALVYYRSALKLVPDFAEALLQSGMIYGKYFNRLDSSIIYLEKSIKANPNIAEAYENLGTAYGMNKNLPAAIGILNEGLKRFPNNSKLYYNLGVSYQMSGNAAKGAECMKKSKELEQVIKPN